MSNAQLTATLLSKPRGYDETSQNELKAVPAHLHQDGRQQRCASAQCDVRRSDAWRYPPVAVACDYPLKGFRTSALGGGSGALTFNPLKAINSTNPVLVGCGRCTGCRIQKAQEWAIRCTHEASMYDANSFITLTYADENLPDNYSVSVREWQLFMKRLRFVYPEKIRFFACGEYGEKTFRPHYHALIFNCEFNDKSYYKTERDNKLYTSTALSTLWPYGLATLGDVTYQSAAYVTRYVMKKMVGDKADEHYWRYNPVTGQNVRQATEFAVMSRRPGIGSSWFDKWKADAFPSDFVIVDGVKKPVPEFYTKKLLEEEQEQIKRRRKRDGIKRKPDQTPARLRARAQVRDARISQLKRSLEDH